MHSLLEEYLYKLELNLKPLPKKRRENELAEIRQHLASTYEDQIQSGAFIDIPL